MKLNKLNILVLIILLAAFLRFWKLGSAPISVNWDEASLGYNSYSVLKSGRDEWGNLLPAIFPAFGDYKLPVYVYSSILPIFFFGLNNFSTRFVSALAGTFTILAVYLLTNQLQKSQKTKLSLGVFNLGHITALITALLPWHFFLSRPALEASLGLSLFTFGLYFLIHSLEKRQSLVLAASFWALSIHTYNSYRVLVPLFGIIFLVFYFKQIFKIDKYLVWSALITILASIILLYQMFTGQGLARYDKLKILNQNTIFQIGENRSRSQLPSTVSRLIYNRPVYFVTTVLKNHISYFGFSFWNQTNGAQTQFAIPKYNLVTYPLLVLLVLGIIYLSKYSKNKLVAIFLIYFFLSPIAASITNSPPQAIRPSPMIPFVVLFSGYGLVWLSKIMAKKTEAVVCVFLFVYLLCTLMYLKHYWTSYLFEYSSSWQYGYNQVFDYINKNGHSYQNIFITKKYGEPHIFDLFYNKINPNVIQSEDQTIRFSKSDWLWTDKIKNHYYVNDWQIPVSSIVNLKLESGITVSAGNSLLITSPDHIPSNSIILKVVNFLDGQPAFIITKVP